MLTEIKISKADLFKDLDSPLCSDESVIGLLIKDENGTKIGEVIAVDNDYVIGKILYEKLPDSQTKLSVSCEVGEANNDKNSL